MSEFLNKSILDDKEEKMRDLSLEFEFLKNRIKHVEKKNESIMNKINNIDRSEVSPMREEERHTHYSDDFVQASP